MTRQEQFLFKLGSPSGFDETQVKLLVRAVNFIADDRMTEGAQMYANLMSSACPRNGAKHAETIPRRGGFFKPPFNKKFRLRSRTRRINHLFKQDRRILVLALTIQRSVDDLVFPLRPAANDCKIFFAKLMSLHQKPKIARSSRGFCDQHETAGFAVEPVHDRNLPATGDLEREQVAQLFPESRRNAWLCRVNKKKRRLVDDDIVIGLIDNPELE
jgi:hypothetical protein